MGTKIVISTRKPKKKLSPRSSIQKGNSGASVGFCTIIPHSVVCQLGPVRAFICGATVGVSGPRSFSKTIPLWVTTKVLTPDDLYPAVYSINFKPLLVLPVALTPYAG